MIPLFFPPDGFLLNPKRWTRYLEQELSPSSTRNISIVPLDLLPHQPTLSFRKPDILFCHADDGEVTIYFRPFLHQLKTYIHLLRAARIIIIGAQLMIRPPPMHHLAKDRDTPTFSYPSFASLTLNLATLLFHCARDTGPLLVDRAFVLRDIFNRWS